MGVSISSSKAFIVIQEVRFGRLALLCIYKSRLALTPDLLHTALPAIMVPTT